MARTKKSSQPQRKHEPRDPDDRKVEESDRVGAKSGDPERVAKRETSQEADQEELGEDDILEELDMDLQGEGPDA
jgi:hypothetical protein